MNAATASLAWVPYDLLVEMISNNFGALSYDDFDYLPFPVHLLALQLVNKRFRSAVLQEKSSTLKWITSFRCRAPYERVSRGNVMMVNVCRTYGSVSLVEWIWASLKFPFTRDCCVAAAEGGHLELLRWGRTRTTSPWSLEASDYRSIAMSDCKDLVLWVKETFPRQFEETTFLYHCIVTGKVELVRWLSTFIEVRFDDRSITRHAVRSGNVKMVEYVISRGAPIKDMHDLIEVAASTNLPMVKLLREKYQLERREKSVTQCAAVAKQLPILKYLHENSYPIYTDLGTRAFVQTLDLDLLVWCKENNFANFVPSNDMLTSVFTTGIGKSNRSADRLRMLEYLISCEKEVVSIYISMHKNSTWDLPPAMWKRVLSLLPKPDPILFEHAIYCTSYYALDTVKYLVEEVGHTFHVELNSSEVKFVRKDVLEYLIASKSVRIREDR